MRPVPCADAGERLQNVRLHGLRRDDKPAGDLGVREPLADQDDDVALAPRDLPVRDRFLLRRPVPAGEDVLAAGRPRADLGDLRVDLLRSRNRHAARFNSSSISSISRRSEAGTSRQTHFSAIRRIRRRDTSTRRPPGRRAESFSAPGRSHKPDPTSARARTSLRRSSRNGRREDDEPLLLLRAAARRLRASR
jgi:hypothetical protein